MNAIAPAAREPSASRAAAATPNAVAIVIASMVTPSRRLSGRPTPAWTVLFSPGGGTKRNVVSSRRALEPLDAGQGAAIASASISTFQRGSSKARDDDHRRRRARLAEDSRLERGRRPPQYVASVMNIRVRTTSLAARSKLLQSGDDDLEAAARLGSGSGSQEPSGQIGAVPETSTGRPRARRGDTRSCPRTEPGADAPALARPSGEVLAHPLDRLGEALVGSGQRDAEEALAAGPVHRARARSPPRPPRAPARRTRSRCGRRGPAPRRRSCPSAARPRRRSRAARRRRGRGGARRSRSSPRSCSRGPVQRRGAGELDRLEQARVDVRLQPPVGVRSRRRCPASRRSASRSC